MAVMHRTTITPTKLELLNSWLPDRPWYDGGPGGPKLEKAGGFRLDDPEGEVGIEFMVVTDASGPQLATYQVPLTYRGAPLEGAEHALVGTMEHGVLGKRWAYDGCHDPVLVAQLPALIEGRAQAQAQSISNTPDREVTASYTGEGSLSTDFAPTAADGRESTEVAAPEGATLRLHRVLQPAPDGPFVPGPGVIGHVTGHWNLPDDARARGVFATLHAGNRA
ncbi:1,4-alpha-glucan branching protein [Streptomyces sp. NPDC042319]|uniref:maltokinase N-terminal cap-like domain-containing protein n=1 Tax=Streptomyces sp. NPDC042319 TaxID=3154332 RepID=UPI003408A2E2